MRVEPRDPNHGSHLLSVKIKVWLLTIDPEARAPHPSFRSKRRNDDFGDARALPCPDTH